MAGETSFTSRGNIYLYVAIAILFVLALGSAGAYYVIQDNPTEEFGTVTTEISESKRGVTITATELSAKRVVIVTPNDIHKISERGGSVTVTLLQRDQLHIFKENSFGRRTLHRSYVVQKTGTSRLAPRPANPSQWSNSTFVATEHYITRVTENGNERWRYLHPEFQGEATFPDEGCYEGRYLYGCEWMDTDLNDANDVFAITHEPGEVIAINKFGKNRWNHSYDSYERLTAIEAYDGKVFVGHTGSESAAVSWVPQRTGEWNSDNIRVFNPPVEDDGTTVTVTDIQRGPDESLYISTRHGQEGGDANATIYRWSPQQDKVWTQTVSTTRASGSRFLYTSKNDDVYVGLDDRVLRLDSKTGDVVWGQPLTTPPNSLALSQGAIYLSQENRRIQRIDRGTGVPIPNTVWPAHFGSSQTRVVSNCGATESNTGYFVAPGHQHSLQIVRPNATVVWSHQTADPTYFAGCTIANP